LFLTQFLYVTYVFVFFFSSRRRHTRCYRDWSSDVCSSDLDLLVVEPPLGGDVCARSPTSPPSWGSTTRRSSCTASTRRRCGSLRSEERRVGKEWRHRW